jgi:hypothetical protein
MEVTGIWQFTHVGKYQAGVVSASLLGELRKANYDAVPRAVFTATVALRDTIQPFPTFSEVYAAALKALHAQITKPVTTSTP